MKRRDFLRAAGLAGLAGAGIPSPGFSAQRFFPWFGPNADGGGEQLFPYDAELFEAAERIVFLSRKTASLNILPKAGKSLDIKLFRSAGSFYLANASIMKFSGVDDSLDIPLKNDFWGPELYYRIEYRETSSRGAWKSTPARRVKTPNPNFRNGRIEALFIGDDHTFDDADMGARVVTDEAWRDLRLNGDYVNEMLKKLVLNPAYLPDAELDPAAKTMSGFCLASTIRQILAAESPDLIVILGDTNGIGAGYKWKGLGLRDPQFGLPASLYDDYAKLFWIRMRKMYSALTPHIPVYIALGNHDGEAGSDVCRLPASKYRRKYWKMPGAENGHSSEENYFSLVWGGDWAGAGGMQFLVLDSDGYNNPLRLPKTPEEWTLGAAQKAWFKQALAQESDWKFVFFHHVLGGWPFGTDERTFDYAYGRGPLFTAEQYRPYVKNPEAVEQVELTRLMQAAGVRANFYGHDHIHHARKISRTAAGRDMFGICVGSTKHSGEINWYEGPIWQSQDGYGSYGTYFGFADKTTGKPAAFWGPSGYTKLSVSRDGAGVDYIRSANNHPNTNLPPTLRVGDAVSSLFL